MKEKLIELHLKGLNDSEIGKVLNLSSQKIWYERSKLGLKSNFDYKSRHKISEEELLNIPWEKLTDLEISNILHSNPSTTYFARRRYNLKREPLNKNNDVIFTDKQIALLKGCLLGDGSLKIGKGSLNARFSCEHGIKQKEYCYWKFKELESAGFSFKTYKRKTPDKRNGILYESAIVSSPAYMSLTTIYKNLYNSKKAITEEFLEDFNELSLAVMFMDDGSISNNSFRIYTNCFSENDLNVFNKFCLNKWNIKFNVQKDNILYLPFIYKSKFIELISEYVHPSMRYKMVPLKSDKLLEHPGEDNQQPI